MVKSSRAWMSFGLRNCFRCILKDHETKNIIEWRAYDHALNLATSLPVYLRRLDLIRVLTDTEEDESPS